MPRNKTRDKDRTSASMIKKRERALAALEMRKEGYTYRQIKDKLKYSSEGNACRAVTELLKSTARESADGLREIELSRLDDWLVRINKKLKSANGNLPELIKTGLRIVERRAKLLGLDAPLKLDARVIHEPAVIQGKVIELFRNNPELWQEIKTAVEGGPHIAGELPATTDDQ